MTNRFTGSGDKSMSDEQLRRLAGMSRAELELAVANGELPQPLKRPPGSPRRWNGDAVMSWLASRRARHVTGI